MTPKNTLPNHTTHTNQANQAQLWIGAHAKLVNLATQQLQKTFCENICEKNKCGTCVTCKNIKKQQHHGAIWLTPEKFYTRDQIQVIFDTISFKLEKNQKLFFIVQHADFLSESCSNSLLKSVEEPPEGYHFIFLAERLSQILPTIQSRCIINSFYEKEDTHNQNQLFTIFKNTKACPPAEFLKLLDTQKPNEKETIEILDSLLNHWLTQSKSAITSGDQKTYKFCSTKIVTLKKALEYSPMPGSSKIFWRNFYLQFNTTYN